MFLLQNFPKRYLTKRINVRCPNCNEQFYWTRPLRKKLDEFNCISTNCHRCNILFWIEKTYDGNGLIVIVNRV